MPVLMLRAYLLLDIMHERFGTDASTGCAMSFTSALIGLERHTNSDSHEWSDGPLQ
jgi:hypothetical protein